MMERIGRYLGNRIPVTRNTFVKVCLLGAAVLLSRGGAGRAFAAKIRAETKPRPRRKILTDCDLAVAEGPDPALNTVRAVDKLGGMERFVKRGSTVLVKPNIGWNRTPAQAANTDPAVVVALIEMCFRAGAKRVNVFDVTCDEEKGCYERSGIAAAARGAGATVFFPDHRNVLLSRYPYKSGMEGWPLIREGVECDTFINVPVLKHHGTTRLTLSIKNLMGVCGSKRGLMHLGLPRKLVDLADFLHPELNVIDATRVLVRHGPGGGDLEDVEKKDMVIASSDASLADAFACGVVGVDPMEVSYLEVARKRGLGNTYPAKAKVVRVRS